MSNGKVGWDKAAEDFGNVTGWLKDMFTKAAKATSAVEETVEGFRGSIHVGNPNVCPTCAGRGSLGAVGHEVLCPNCTAKPFPPALPERK